VSARILILIGVTSDRIDSRLRLYSSPTIGRQDGLQFVDKPYEATVGFFLVPSRRSIAGNIVSDAVNTAIHTRQRGIKEVFSLFSLDCWTTKAAQGLTAASAIASCRSRLRPWLVSIDDENLVSVATVGVASDAKDVLSALKLATKNKAVRIEGCTVHLFLLPS
jgi:hypothetical protein